MSKKDDFTLNLLNKIKVKEGKDAIEILKTKAPKVQSGSKRDLFITKIKEQLGTT